ncbi:MAG: NADH-quinone oxidoreductase subunit J [Deltaproteobacteria bacterium]|nr:NADH-quinone oxidoreductase subunit J [Deltaproteobacteria bacterium]
MNRTFSKLALWAFLALLVALFLGYFITRVLPDYLPAGRAVPPRLGDLVFYACAAATVAGAAGVAFSRNIVWSCIGLLIALLGTAALYVFLSADFLAVAQLLVYIGGVLVLILFAVMLTNRIGEVNVSNQSLGLGGGLAVFAAVAPLLMLVAVLVPWPVRPPGPMAPTTARIGDEFLSTWLLPFEVASVVLLATLVGAVVMARKELKAD